MYMLVRINMKIINAFHIFVIGTLLLTIGLMRDNASVYLYYALLFVTLCIVIVVPFPSFNMNIFNIVRAFHYLFILPLLLYASYLGIVSKKISTYVYDIYGGVGGFIIAYHSIKLIKRLM